EWKASEFTSWSGRWLGTPTNMDHRARSINPQIRQSTAQHHVEPRARNHDITQRSEQREQVDLPRRPRVFQHNEARPHRFRGVTEKRRQDHVLCALDIDLDGVDRVDPCALQELQQGLCIDGWSISPRRFHDAGAAAIASINLERHLADSIPQGNRSDADGYAGIDPDIERQTRQVFRVRLDRENAAFRSARAATKNENSPTLAPTSTKTK